MANLKADGHKTNLTGHGSGLVVGHNIKLDYYAFMVIIGDALDEFIGHLKNRGGNEWVVFGKSWIDHLKG